MSEVLYRRSYCALMRVLKIKGASHPGRHISSGGQDFQSPFEDGQLSELDEVHALQGKDMTKGRAVTLNQRDKYELLFMTMNKEICYTRVKPRKITHFPTKTGRGSLNTD